jgi:hypothetical protein
MGPGWTRSRAVWWWPTAGRLDSMIRVRVVESGLYHATRFMIARIVGIRGPQTSVPAMGGAAVDRAG